MTTRLFFERIRRSLGRSSEVVLASSLPPAVEGRPDDYRLSEARVIEDRELVARPVGSALGCEEPLAFVDGVQRYEVVGYVGVHPVVSGIVAAAVRVRRDGHFTTVARDERRLLVARREVLDRVSSWTDGLEIVALDLDRALLHPLKELEVAKRAIDTARAALERSVANRFREGDDAWLVFDGVLPDEESWATDRRAVGVSKSHGMLPFSGADLPRYLSLPVSHRSSIFIPDTGRSSPVHSWGLRLWPHEGRDLLHGLVRIEIAATDEGPARADLLSRWLLAERVPLARPDPRWDRLLYGVATVERHLKAQ